MCVLYQYLAPHDDAPLHRHVANLEHWKDAFKDTAGIRGKKNTDYKNQGELIKKKENSEQCNEQFGKNYCHILREREAGAGT